MDEIKHFVRLANLEHYDCFRMGIVAIVKNYYIPELTPAVFEAGNYNLDFNYHPEKSIKAHINDFPVNSWRQYYHFLPLDYDLLYIDAIKENFGLTIISGDQIKDSIERLDFVYKYVQQEKLPVIIGCNPYHLPYNQKDYLINPGGYFNSYHFLVVLKIDKESVWVYDSVIGNYLGKIPLDNFLQAIHDRTGINHEAGFKLAVITYNKKKFSNLHFEILEQVLRFYFKKKPSITDTMNQFFTACLFFYEGIQSLEKKKLFLTYLEKSLFFYSISRRHFCDFLAAIESYKEIAALRKELWNIYEQIFAGTKILFINSQRNANSFLFTLKKLEIFLNNLCKALDREVVVFQELYSYIFDRDKFD